MIQPTLFFILGFLCASLLALMAAPAIWRRAVVLTRQRVEASVPLTLDEVQAEKDRMRAEFAMATRRLEMEVSSSKEHATRQLIEISSQHEHLKRASNELEERKRAIEDLEDRIAELREELAERERTIKSLADRIDEMEHHLQGGLQELERTGRLYEEASFNASSRQIELVAQEAKLEKLSEDLNVLRSERRDADSRVRQLTSELREAREALADEHKRVKTMEDKNESLTAALAEREEKLERRERDLLRLREQVMEKDQRERRSLASAQTWEAERARLEMELADLHRSMASNSGMPVGPAPADDGAHMRSAEQLSSLKRDNDRLKAELERLRQIHDENWGDERRGAAVLRERMQELASQVVVLTAELEGPDSPIHGSLMSSGKGRGLSLADRIKALQTAAGKRRQA